MTFIRRAVMLAAALTLAISAAAQELDTTAIDQVFGRSGTKIGDVYKLAFPRTDLRVSVDGVAILPGFALGSWAAFSGTNTHAVLMGDLVLLPEEVGPVMAQLRASGLEITALHNHLLFESPRLMYLHYRGQGMAVNLAKALRAALGASATPLGPPAPAAPAAAVPRWAAAIEKILGRRGAFNGGVLSISVPRFNEVTEDALELPPAMGVAESLNFESAGAGKVAATGDFVLTSNEVNPVISALEGHHIAVTALHNHMLEEEPRLFFLHFWAVAAPKAVAQGLKAALANVRTELPLASAAGREREPLAELRAGH